MLQWLPMYILTPWDRLLGGDLLGYSVKFSSEGHLLRDWSVPCMGVLHRGAPASSKPSRLLPSSLLWSPHFCLPRAFFFLVLFILINFHIIHFSSCFPKCFIRSPNPGLKLASYIVWPNHFNLLETNSLICKVRGFYHIISMVPLCYSFVYNIT